MREVKRHRGTGRAASQTDQSADVRRGVARAIARAGRCSRSEAQRLVAAGRVCVDGRKIINPEYPTTTRSRIEIDGEPLQRAAGVYLMMNKPRGLVTTAQDERGRPTVYQCFEGHELPWIAPVGRLDQASEGLLLFTNDSAWAAAITEPGGGCAKTYRVQVTGTPSAEQLPLIAAGARCGDEWLDADSVQLLRTAEKSCWLEIALSEGRNRHLRRLLEAFDLEVRRLIRVSIGSLALGDLAKGQWRALEPAEVAALSGVRSFPDGRG